MQNTETEQVVLHMDQQMPKTKSGTELNDLTPISIEKLPNSSRNRSLNRLNFSKPKSRFVETNYPLPSKSEEFLQPLISQENHQSSDEDSDSEDFSEDEEEDDEGGDSIVKHKKKKKKRWRRIHCRWRCLIEWISFFVIMTALICSLTLKSLKEETKWGLKIWKWCLIMMVIICGRLVSGWVVSIIVFFIERNYMLREKVLYFVYGLRKSIQKVFWFGFVLLAWSLMFSSDVQQNNKIVQKFYKGLVAFYIGALIWLVKILLVKILASSFHVATFFDRMKESVFHHYVLERLSGRPIDEEPQINGENLTQLTERLKYGRKGTMKRLGTRKIDMEMLRKLSLENSGSALTAKRLMSYVMSSGMSTISRTIDDIGKTDSEITSEKEAKSCAQRIFKNVAKPGAKYIEEVDLLKFLTREEVYTIFPFFEGHETGQIRKSSFRNWVVRAYFERKSLAHSLNDTKTAVHQLHRLASAIVSVIIVVVFLLVMGLATSKIIVVFSSQLLLVGFMFQNTCKTVFESIIFVFVMHPFDVGDRCVIDGVQMIVEEMNILTTVFLRYDNEKIFYPNSVLSTKPISNFYRSPEMADCIDFNIDVSTSVENVNALKKAIQVYIESKPKYWNQKHSLIVKEIENVDKMKMSLCVIHTINHQNFGERNIRRSELVFELKKIFETLGIKYHVLPQEVHLTQVNMTGGRIPMQS